MLSLRESIRRRTSANEGRIYGGRYFGFLREYRETPRGEKEVVVITKTVGHALEEFDLVVHAFEHAGVQRPLTVHQDAGHVPPEPAGEALPKAGMRLLIAR